MSPQTIHIATSRSQTNVQAKIYAEIVKEKSKHILDPFKDPAIHR